MLRLFDCAVLAARAQLAIALLIGILLAASSTGWAPAWLASVDPADLKWIFLATAAVAATGFRQSLSRTAARVAHETDVLARGRAKRLRLRLLLNLRGAVAAMAVLTITPAPDLLLRAVAPLLDRPLVQAIWAGAMSVGVAYFGAAASAARRTIRRRRLNVAGA